MGSAICVQQLNAFSLLATIFCSNRIYFTLELHNRTWFQFDTVFFLCGNINIFCDVMVDVLSFIPCILDLVDASSLRTGGDDDRVVFPIRKRAKIAAYEAFRAPRPIDPYILHHVLCPASVPPTLLPDYKTTTKKASPPPPPPPLPPSLVGSDDDYSESTADTLPEPELRPPRRSARPRRIIKKKSIHLIKKKRKKKVLMRLDHGERRYAKTSRKLRVETGQTVCCLKGCSKTVFNRLRFSLRLRTNDDVKESYIVDGWHRICCPCYFDDLYRWKKIKKKKERRDKMAKDRHW